MPHTINGGNEEVGGIEESCGVWVIDLNDDDDHVILTKWDIDFLVCQPLCSESDVKLVWRLLRLRSSNRPRYVRTECLQ
ncbi:hypothetical protein Tco_1415562, partial [Tanacetum coccineum]